MKSVFLQKLKVGWAKRELRFEVFLEVTDLNHIPQSTGVVFLKWKCTSKFGQKQIQGFTKRVNISKNRASWNEKAKFVGEFTVDNETNVIDPFILRLSARMVHLLLLLRLLK
jgi:hypothetical protein